MSDLYDTDAVTWAEQQALLLRRIAAAETGLAGLPEVCPWTIAQVLGLRYWPGPPWHPDDGAAP